MKRGQTFSGWRIVRVLQAIGHTGEVFLVESVSEPGRSAVLKHFCASCTGRKEHFLAEKQFLLDRPVPAIMPRILAHGDDKDGTPYFIMERVKPLPKKLKYDQLVILMKEIIAACAALYAVHYYHCDIKPSNIGLLNGHVVLFDYGCTMKTSVAHREPLKAGTDWFQAPEVAKGMISIMSEVYSLGKTVLKLAHWTALPRIASAVLAATDKDPFKRPQTFEALSALFDQSNADFMKAALLVTRFRLKAVIIGFLTLAIIAIGYGWLTACNNRWLIESHRDHYGDESAQKSQIDIGLAELGSGNPTNGLKILNDAANSQEFQKYRYREEEVYYALGYCHLHSVGTKTNKTMGTFYRRKARALKPQADSF